LKRKPPQQPQQLENYDTDENTDCVDDEPIPQTKEEIRAARLKFFSKIGK
jgi:hypothetical protein